MIANGAGFPAMTLNAAEKIVSLPHDHAGSFGLVLAYRGAWCPFCTAQLADFAQAWDALSGAGVKMAALSVEDEATARSVIDKHAIRFPVAYSVDAAAFAAATGAFLGEGPRRIEPTAFILMPDGTVGTSLYASGPIGRLTSAEVLKFVTFVKARMGGQG